jgi:nitrogen fixation/metabolism regulation signal transduction histidine kinase
MVRVDRNDKLGTLAETLNKMSHNLSARIFERRQTSQEIRKSCQLLSTVFESIIEGVIAVDNDGHLLFPHEAAILLLVFADQG